MVQTGVDVALTWLRGGGARPGLEPAAALLRRGRLGLVTNPSAVTADLTAAPDALLAAGARIEALFGPEHGVRGEAPDGRKIPHGRDERTGIRVWSLYGEQTGPSPEMLQGLDALVFDIQDVGSRFYTYSSTLSHVMEAARDARLPVLVLDRPNPIGGTECEGPVLEPGHRSFVGLHPIPVRHGASMGELARLWAGFGAGDPPLVVPCRGWRRRHQWDRTGRDWVPTSPAMPDVDTALVYPGACFLEGTNVSEGRGTANPFRWFGAPWVDAETLAGRLNGEGLPGVRFRPVRFIPTASKWAGETCAGCQIHVRDPGGFLPVATGVAVLCALRAVHPARFEWRSAGGRFALDRLAGTSRVREEVDAGRSWGEIAAAWAPGIAAYRARLRGVMLYE